MVLTITEARAHLSQLASQTIATHEAVEILTKRGVVILQAKDDAISPTVNGVRVSRPATASGPLDWEPVVVSGPSTAQVLDELRAERL